MHIWIHYQLESRTQLNTFMAQSDSLDIFYFSKIFSRCLHNSQFECVN